MKLPVSPHLQNKKQKQKTHKNVANQIEFLLNENVYLWLRRSDSEHAFKAMRKRSALCLDSNFHFFFFFLNTEI